MPIKMAMLKFKAVGENAFLNIFTKCWISKQPFTSKSNNFEDAIGYPEKPKPPTNGFLKFFINSKTDFAVRNGTRNPKELLQIMSKAWKEMSEKEREKFKKEYDNERLEYKEKLVAYKNALTQTQKDDLMKMKEKIKMLITSGSHYSKKELVQSFKKPVHPVPSFSLFLKQFKGTGTSITTISKAWKNLPDSERKKYMNEYKNAMEKYSENLKNWEIKMIKEGNLDAVSTQTLKKLAQKF